ncbi:hypothetical protein D9M73_198820 [compost metagenome]
MACWLPAPAPLAMVNGTTPRMNASEVMMIGRRRMRHASIAASYRLRPCSCSSLANSTIKMAFFAARPMVVNRPTRKYTSLDRPRRLVAISAPMMPSGTTSSTAIGIDQLSYSAARHRNTNSTERANSAGICEPESFSS